MIFKDLKCGNCIGTCCKIGGVYLTSEEIDILKLNNIDFANKLELTKLNGYLYKIKQDKNNWCVFYQTDSGTHCSIYNFRPQLCKDYRIGSCNIKRKENENKS